MRTLVGAACCLVLSACGAGGSDGSAGGSVGAVRTGVAGPAAPVAAALASASAVDSLGPPHYAVLPAPRAGAAALGGPPAAGPGALFDLTEGNGFQRPGNPFVERLPLDGGPVLVGGPLAGSPRAVALAAGVLWVATGQQSYETPDPTVAAPGTSLTLLDPTTLVLRQRLSTPTGAQALAVVGADVWVGGTDGLALLDGATGAVLRTVPVPGTVAELSVRGTGPLYDLEGPGDAAPDTLVERDPATGAVLGRYVGGDPGLGLYALAADDDGAWFTVPTGMLGGVVHVAADALPGGGTSLRTGRSTYHDVAANPAGDAVWITASGGVLGCVRADGGFHAVTGMLVSGDAPGTLVENGGTTYVLHDGSPRPVAPPRVCAR